MRNSPERYLLALQEHFSSVHPLAEDSAGNRRRSSTSKAVPFTTNQSGKETAFQRWFHFKEAFSPAFVSTAIEALGFTPKHIIDPFGGSGTSAISSQLLGIDITTVEVNPFLADVIQAKVSILSAEKLRRAAAEFQARLIQTRSNIKRFSHLPETFIEAAGKERWIFPRSIAKRLSQYLTCIEGIECPDTQRFFRVVLGAILIDCSNVYVNGKGRRYRGAWEQNEPTAEDLDELFGSQFNVAFADVLNFEERPRSATNVINGDSRFALETLQREADLIVFSPPYPNSFDYTDIYNVELWILGYIGSSHDNRQLRTNTLSSHVQIKRKFDMPINASLTLSSTVASLVTQKNDLWDENIPAMVGAYFRDMETILKQCHRLLTAQGKVIMVVGDSRYATVKIDVAAILSELAQAIGFTNVQIREVRQMRSSAQQGGRLQLAESIVELSL